MIEQPHFNYWLLITDWQFDAVSLRSVNWAICHFDGSEDVSIRIARKACTVIVVTSFKCLGC